ncbi:hypothetical protein DUZ99_17850 [Xylanibacillus composti]|uniref:Uncharacterized protein n=1 Tax=Xylanibacillus composti TaxID=1572762 RepID=A0A8J4M415_9BACL|nr:hypothetical protein [Xylanibacillus composti]MDT9726845.1 hypothetical protein [Xylanibacillus composti]GIQ70640.1 hypothetical protein XYCOK13_34640 [Xylanibacillus composti]
MKLKGVIVSLLVGAALGISAMVLGGSEMAASLKESPSPEGSMEIPHNERLHLSTDKQWIAAEGHLSDLIRLQWTKERAKPAISWLDENGQNKTAIVSHGKANNPEQHDHNHMSFETTMSPDGQYRDQLFTRLEIPYDQDVAEIRTHSSNFNVMDGILRISGTEGVPRDLTWAKSVDGNVTTPRWAIRADASEESGGNAGSNLQMIRYSDDGEALDSPFTIMRSSGNIGIGNADPQARLDISDDSIRIRESKTPESSSSSGQVGEIAWDNGYVYICVAPNTWKRAALSSW